ncbi:MAG: pilin [Candidatus Paceibacterota bacterium]
MKNNNQLKFNKLFKTVLLGGLLVIVLVFPNPANAEKIAKKSQDDPAVNARVVVDPDTFRVTDETLDQFDPLLVGGSDKAQELSTLGGIISRVLTFAFPLAGMIMFVMIVAGGFQMLTGAAGQKSMEEGKKKVTSAVIGFIILFSSYWIAQLLEQIFNIRILN